LDHTLFEFHALCHSLRDADEVASRDIGLNAILYRDRDR
jgi:hypothetical protein